jgi:hypothetical protein
VSPFNAYFPAQVTSLSSVTTHKRRHELQENIAAEGSPSVGETIQRTIVIGGRQFSFRAFGLPGGKTSVGTVIEGVFQRNVAEP